MRTSKFPSCAHICAMDTDRHKIAKHRDINSILIYKSIVELNRVNDHRESFITCIGTTLFQNINREEKFIELNIGGKFL